MSDVTKKTITARQKKEVTKKTKLTTKQKKGVRRKTKLSLQQKKINRRLKEWTKSEDNVLRIDSMLYRLKDHNDDVLALRQYVINKKSGEKPDDTIIIFKSELPSVIDQLTKLNGIINKTDDEWDLKLHQANYRSEIAKDYAAKIMESLTDMIIEKCEGCIHDQQNQLAYDLCLMADTETQVSTCIDTLLEKVDNFRMNEVCFDRLKRTFTLPISMEKLYLTLPELKNDSNWINDVKRYTITFRERFMINSATNT